MTEVRTLPLVDEMHDPMRATPVFIGVDLGRGPSVSVTVVHVPGAPPRPAGTMPILPLHMGGPIRG